VLIRKEAGDIHKFLFSAPSWSSHPPVKPGDSQPFISVYQYYIIQETFQTSKKNFRFSCFYKFYHTTKKILVGPPESILRRWKKE